MEAVRWYRMAADQSYARAQYRLGYCYENGTGVSKDAEEAVRWYRMAADQGHFIAKFNMIVCYWKGKFVRRDSVEAACGKKLE